MDPNSTLHGLERFVEAQDRVYAFVLEELAAGNKTSHWMWFTFPQLKALGRSSIAKHFGIKSQGEAFAYWHHPVLGKRLKECTQLVLAVGERTANEIFGSPDDLKFRSCMTLFAQVAPEEPVFSHAKFSRSRQRVLRFRRDCDGSHTDQPQKCLSKKMWILARKFF